MNFEFNYLDSRGIFNFIDINKDSCLTYLEFRSWILLIDRTLTENDVLELFNDIDQNRKKVFFLFFLEIFVFCLLDDGSIDCKEFQDYFGKDLLTSEPSIVDLTELFHEIDINHSGNITLNKLLKFFNHQSSMITKEEGEIFLGTISDIGNENSISFKGKICLKLKSFNKFLFLYFFVLEFIKAMHNWKI